ncbi:MAG: hypothetical protein KGY75_10400 [Candidatus Cloacimonetes bacterium]|nr:hypothetical protein [Candidatus Cloacimonadota bacterium]
MKSKNLFPVILIIVYTFLLLGGCAQDTTSPVPEESKIGWIVGDPIDGYGTILYTKDGGQNWQRQGDSLSVPDCHLNTVRAVDSLNVWIVGDQLSGMGTILKTNDGGDNWQWLGDKSEIPNEEFLGLYTCSSDEVWIVGSNNTIIHTSDGGNTWESKADTAFLPYNLCSITIEGDKIWVCGNTETLGGTIIHSDDYGETWTKQAEGEFLQERGMIEISAGCENSVWCVGHGRTVLHTSNGGSNWDVQRTDINPTWDANGVTAINGNIAWVVEDLSYIRYTENGGENWTTQDVPPGAGAYLLYRICPLNTKEAWAVGPYGGKFDFGVILYTDDGGKTWVMQDYEPNVMLWDVSFVDSYH